MEFSIRFVAILFLIMALMFVVKSHLSNIETYQSNIIKEPFQSTPPTDTTLVYRSTFSLQNLIPTNPLQLQFSTTQYNNSEIILSTGGYSPNTIGSQNRVIYGTRPPITLGNINNRFIIIPADSYESDVTDFVTVKSNDRIKIRADVKSMNGTISEYLYLHATPGISAPTEDATSTEVSIKSYTTKFPNGSANDVWIIKSADPVINQSSTFQLIHETTGYALASIGGTKFRAGTTEETVIGAVFDTEPTPENRWKITNVTQPTEEYLDKYLCKSNKEKLDKLYKDLENTKYLKTDAEKSYQSSTIQSQIDKIAKTYNAYCDFVSFKEFNNKNTEFTTKINDLSMQSIKMDNDLYAIVGEIDSIKSETESLRNQVRNARIRLDNLSCRNSRCVNPVNTPSNDIYSNCPESVLTELNAFISSPIYPLANLLEKIKPYVKSTAYNIQDHPDFAKLVPVSQVESCSKDLEALDYRKHPDFSKYVLKSSIPSTFSYADIPDSSCYIRIDDIPKQKKITDFTIQEIVAEYINKLTSSPKTVEGFAGQCIPESLTSQQASLLANLGYSVSPTADQFVSPTQSSGVVSEPTGSFSSPSTSVASYISDLVDTTKPTGSAKAITFGDIMMSGSIIPGSIQENISIKDMDPATKAAIESRIQSNDATVADLRKKVQVLESIKDKNIVDTEILLRRMRNIVSEFDAVQKDTQNLKAQLYALDKALGDQKKIDINSFPITSHKDIAKYVRRDQVPCWGCNL